MDVSLKHIASMKESLRTQSASPRLDSGSDHGSDQRYNKRYAQGSELLFQARAGRKRHRHPWNDQMKYFLLDELIKRSPGSSIKSSVFTEIKLAYQKQFMDNTVDEMMLRNQLSALKSVHKLYYILRNMSGVRCDWRGNLLVSEEEWRKFKKSKPKSNYMTVVI